MRRRHGDQDRPERKTLGRAAESEFDNEPECGERDRNECRDGGDSRNSIRTGAGDPEQDSVHGVAADRTDQSHVDDVETERSEASVGEQQSLDDQDDRYDEKTRPRAYEDGGQDPSEQMTGHPGQDREVDHLSREHECRDERGHWNQSVGQVPTGARNGNAETPGRYDAGRCAHTRTDNTVWDVHGILPDTGRDQATATIARPDRRRPWFPVSCDRRTSPRRDQMTTPLLPPTTPSLATLEEIERRVLWLSVRMIDYANRRGETEIKVGGHQASSASMVSIMTALWFGHIGGEDKVAVKPHASPLYHSIKYLTGELDRSYLTRLRDFGGLQSYPSRTKDPDVADYSTGSVGLGAVAPLFSAAARRFVDAHYGPRPPARFIATVGDAELDEGNVWEAIADPALQGLGNVTLIVDLNRQSLDRVIPGIQSRRVTRFFADAGWHVVEVKYGAKLKAAFTQEGGDVLRRHIDDMPNEEYQSLFAVEGPKLRARFLENADPAVDRFLSGTDDTDLGGLIRNLGGHDIEELLRAYRRADAVTDRPSVVFAYTVKGRGLPIAGDPMNHSALLSEDQIGDLRTSVGLTAETEWDRFDPESDAGTVCAAVGASINNVPPPPRPAVLVPAASGAVQKTVTSSQEAFGRVLVQLGKDPQYAARMVTASPDVAVSTNLGGWINAQGVFSATESVDYYGADRLLKWTPGPGGRHIELGISEMNLFLLLGQLGLAHEHHGEMLLPIGTVYDPFVLRGLDALIYSLYNDSRFIIVGTPSGVTLAPEGGAHQSSITPSVGLELPGIVGVEPAYAGAVDWLLTDALRDLAVPTGCSRYLRLSTRPIDQTPFADAADRLGEDQIRASVLAGGYRLRESSDGPPLILAASGPVMPEVLAAAALLEEEGVGVTVVDVTSQDRLFHAWRESLNKAARGARLPEGPGHIASLIEPSERSAPIVTVHDAAPHSLAWLGSVFGQRMAPIGVDRFGESGAISDLYEAMGFLPEQIVNSALVALESRDS